MNRKKRILCLTEFSALATGYSNYSNEVLGRLFKTGKYELAELSSYCSSTDKRRRLIPWRTYPVLPNKNDEGVYKSNILNQFGSWKFEETCIDFQPDIIMCFRDHWMDNFAQHSPFRSRYSIVGMPTVDASPQFTKWLADYSKYDILLAYSEFGLRTLKNQLNSSQIYKTASPAADYNTFKPLNKAEIKKRLNLPEDSIIIGTVMRNQKRKLYPDLFLSFKKLLEELPPSKKDKVYLYCHCSPVDLGFDIPALLLRYNISNKVYFTYKCKNCQCVTSRHYQGVNAICNKCVNKSSTPPTTRNGLSREELSYIYNVFDIYVQYANSEGWGIPVIEAVACGVPTAVINYSAMEDFVNNIDVFPIRPLKMQVEPETLCERVIPDNDDCVKVLKKLISQPSNMRRKFGWTSMKKAHKKYTWEKAAQTWMECFDQLPYSRGWSGPPELHQPQTKIPQHITDIDDLVAWGYTHVAGLPTLSYSYHAYKMIRELEMGIKPSSIGPHYLQDFSMGAAYSQNEPFGEKQAMEAWLNLAEFRNRWETARYNRLGE